MDTCAKVAIYVLLVWLIILGEATHFAHGAIMHTRIHFIAVLSLQSEQSMSGFKSGPSLLASPWRHVQSWHGSWVPDVIHWLQRKAMKVKDSTVPCVYFSAVVTRLSQCAVYWKPWLTWVVIGVDVEISKTKYGCAGCVGTGSVVTRGPSSVSVVLETTHKPCHLCHIRIRVLLPLHLQSCSRAGPLSCDFWAY